eukprot:Sspe_Gene.109045::Locus_88369_Transcript_1_1_Confidence_1.000_Length_992::g.109045::m.109045/K14962/WDR82, SWD2, CPS35; COMPASS component SWD2
MEDVYAELDEALYHGNARKHVSECHLPAHRQYGIDKVTIPRITNPSSSSSHRLLFTSRNGWDHTVWMAAIRHDALHPEESFSGHRDSITGLCVPPASANCGHGVFLSSSLDGTTCLWSRDRKTPLHRWRCCGRSAAAFDSSGLVIAVADGSGFLELYDRRRLQNNSQPFGVLKTGIGPDEDVEEIQWFSSASSPNLCCVVGTRSVSVVDTSPAGPTEGRLLGLVAEDNDELAGATVISPDGALHRGSSTGSLYAFDTSTGYAMFSWRGRGVTSIRGHTPATSPGSSFFSSPLVAAEFHPRQWCLAAAAGCDLALWHWPYYAPF